MQNYNTGDFEGGTFFSPICDKTVSAEISCEWELPDYCLPVARILRTRATVCPPDCYVGDSVELSGTLYHDILYVGTDGKLYSTRAETPYSLNVPTDSDTLAEDARTVCRPSAENVSCRLASPRKIMLRTRLGCRVIACAANRPEEYISGTDSSEALRRLTDTAEFCETLTAKDCGISLADEIITEQGEGETRVVSACGNLLVAEANAAVGSVVCRGEITVKILLCREGAEEEAQLLVRKLPFTRDIALDGVTPAYNCRACGTVTEVQASVGEGHISLDVAACLQVFADKRCSFEYTRDIYSMQGSAETSFRTEQLTVPLKCLNSNFTDSGIFELSSVGMPSARILDAEGCVSVGSVVAEGGRCTVLGEVKYDLLCFAEGGYSCHSLTRPVKYETDIPAASAPDAAAELDVYSVRARMDGERVSVDAEISVSLGAWDKKSVNMLAEAAVTPTEQQRAGDCIICYPDRRDTLWSVAKRYRTDAVAVASANTLTLSGSPDAPDTLSGVKFLII